MALTAAAVGAGATASAASATVSAAVTGRVCMFLAPDHIFGLGHVGWAFRADDQSWDYGATRSAASSWRKSGTFADVLAGFRAAGDTSGPYRRYRCRDTAGHDGGAASAKADEAAARPYDFLTDNCLTRSLEIYEAYDGTGDLASLGSGDFTAPRWYFEHDLDGFEAAVDM